MKSNSLTLSLLPSPFIQKSITFNQLITLLVIAQDYKSLHIMASIMNTSLNYLIVDQVMAAVFKCSSLHCQCHG